MNCPKCEKDFEPHHHKQKYCDPCRGVEKVEIPVTANITNNAEIVDIEIGKPHHRHRHNTFDDDACMGKENPTEKESVAPLGPLDVYSKKRWEHLRKNYVFDTSIGRAKCIEMSSNIALPSPGDPGYDGDLKVQKDFAPDHRSLTGPLSVYSLDHWNNLQMQGYAWSESQKFGVRGDGAKAEIIEGDPAFKEVA